MIMKQGKGLVRENATTPTTIANFATFAITSEARNREIRIISTILIHYLTVVITDKTGTIFAAASRAAITKVIAIIK
jgi:hypothetical protein